MTQPLYERYKDALRRGHVAGLRGRLDVALAAYLEAASLAPDRALPHTSMGAILVRVGRFDEARSAFDAALARSPLDEASLRGRAEVLVRLGRRVDAAEDLERLAESLEATGRTAEALDAAREALALAESRQRRRLLERLGRVPRADSDTEPASIPSAERGSAPELASSFGVLEEEPPAPAEAGAAGAAGAGTAGRTADGTSPGADLQPGRATAEGATGESVAMDHAAGEAADSQSGEPAPDPSVLVAEAEALLDTGDRASARPRLIAAIAGYRATGRPDAALDAGLILLGVAPADPELHLALADLQLDRGWRPQASEKLRLLERLAELRDEPEAAAAARALATARLGGAGEG